MSVNNWIKPQRIFILSLFQIVHKNICIVHYPCLQGGRVTQVQGLPQQEGYPSSCTVIIIIHYYLYRFSHEILLLDTI